ncbi:MAG: leucine-rich repeat domain-containing protein, partial [Treponema sp.]|nr:leucine-rich repeat domain-containing protein [Treponema sp.]
MKKVFLFLTVLLFALGISAPVYSGGSQNNVPEVTGPFMQDPDEITYGDGYEYNYYTGESQEDYRKLRVAHSTGDIFERSVDTESFIQLVRPRYAKSHNVYDRKIVEIDYINSWDKNGKRTTIEAIMREEAYFGSYIINTLFEGYDESGQPMGDFVEFATYSYDPETYGDGRKFGVILPGSRVEFQSGRFINILSGAIGWDNDFEAARELEDFMIYLAENVDYDKMKSKVDKTKAAFDALKAKGITNKCPSTPPCACYGDIYKHIIHAANFQAGLWGGFLGAIPPIVLPAKYYSVRKQYAIQANLAASIGYMHGYYPRGGEEFKQRLKIDNFFLFAGHGPDAISFDTILSNFVKEEIIEEYIGDIPGGVNRAKEFYENPTEIPLSYYEDVFEEVKDALIEAIDDKLEDLLPKAISWIPIAGTLWDAGEGAKEAIQETQDMGSRAVKYFRMPRDFYFDPRPNYIITAYIGSDVNVTVPDMIDGDKVKVIAADTFKDKKNDIESVTFLSEGIKTIPANLFADCTSLKTVTFGKSIASIGDKGFYNCPQLTTVTLGGDIKSIGAAAFSGCRQLTTVNIPPNVKKITFGVNAFEGTNLDYATKLRLRKLGYKGAGVGEGFFIVNNTGATIVFIDKKVGSGWSTELTKSVRNGQTVEVELAPGMYDIQLRATTNYPAGDIFRKWDIRVEDTTRITFTADDRYTMERADYQAFIQARCLFYNPASVWEVIDTHAFADSVYKTWAESYPNIPGRRYPFKRPGRRTDQQIIQSLCKFSSPQTVWEVVNTHPNHETIMNVWADSYFNEGGIIDGIAGIIKGLLDGDDNGDIDETITQITPVPTPIPVSVGDYKPAPLPTNATFQQALEKLDEIIAFCDANPSSANNTARYGCNSMRELWEPNSDDLEPNWPIMASANINAINRTIASLDSGTAPQIAPSEAGTFKLTGIPSQYNGKYAVAVGGGNIGPFNDTIAIIGAQDYIRYPTSTTAAPIRGGQVAMNLWTVERLLQSPYRGNHSLSVIIYIVDEASGEDFDEAEHYIGFESVAFRNGGATMAWNDGIVDGVYSSTDPGTFTLTGIPSQYNGKYAMIDAEAAGVIGLQTIAMAGGEPIMTSAPIRSGRAAINLWRLTPVGFAPYKGSDTFKVTVMIYNQGTVTAAEADYITEELSVEFANVSFR